MPRTLPALLLALASTAGLWASYPLVGTPRPWGGQRGSEFPITFVGRNLGDAEEVMFYSPGFEVRDIAPTKNRRAFRAVMRVAPDAALGEHKFRVRTRTGVSDLRTFWVGPFPITEEKEPNSDFDAPQAIGKNVTVHGIANREDVDYYAIEAKKGERVSVEIEGLRLGNTLFDPYIAILDSKRFELKTADDSPLFKQDGLLSVVVPEDGTYVIQVRDSAYGGNGACRYRLHVGDFARPKVAFPAGGEAGKPLSVTLIGDPKGEFSQTVNLPAGTAGEHPMVIRQGGVTTPSVLPLRVSPFANAFEAEPNNSFAQAKKGPQPAAAPVALNGVIGEPGDVDCVRFTAKKGQTFEARCLAFSVGSPLDPVMSIHDAKGKRLAANDDQRGSPDSYARFRAPADGEYFVLVRDHLMRGGADFVYRVELAAPRPTVTLSIPKIGRRTQQIRQTVPVPRGNRYATMITVARRNYGGDVKLDFPGLPAGVDAKNLLAGRAAPQIPVVFEAKKDAPLGGQLVAVVGSAGDPKQQLASAFDHKTQLVVGTPGQSIYLEPVVHRAAVAVTEAAPFAIDIVQPKVPLVRDGSMRLKVVARRDNGFKSPIVLQMLYNPSGVGSSNRVTIPGDKTVGHVTLNANGRARTGTSKIVVIASANVGGGTMYVSSQLADLEVAEPYVTFQMQRTAVEQGETARVFCKIDQKKKFPGKAKVELLGLPNAAKTEVAYITPGAKELTFVVTTEAKTPPGRHRNVFCRVTVEENGEPIVHRSVGRTELRVDKPKKVVKKPTKPKVKKKPAAKKPLSRLEKLRQQQMNREKKN